MSPSAIRPRALASAALVLVLGSFIGCGSDHGGGSAPLPASNGAGPPPPPPKESLGPDGKPASSNATTDTAHGAPPPK